MTQSQALSILKTGANVFVTGPAGSGKTFVINQYIRYLRDHDVPVGITASTGIAATHMGGMTIHAWSGMGIKDRLDEHDLGALAEKPQLIKRFKETQVLIIDEVSMLHHFRLDLLDKLARYLRSVRKLFDAPTSEDGTSAKDKPFGGMQVVLCGDFFQLPPVARMGEPAAHFIYHSEAWKNANFTVAYLEENFRQAGDISQSILNEIRSGEVSEGAREHLAGRHISVQKETVSLEGDPIVEPTRLFTHNVDVDMVNQTELGKVSEVEYIYEMDSRGKRPLVETLKKSCLAPQTLKLKKGARVMCVKNNFEKGYVNGTLGVVISCGPGVDPVIRTATDRLVTLEKASWTIDDNGKILAEINQYPLRLAWAITVHKSQGMSLDAITVDLTRCFEPGMGYVALSRVRTLAGLTILGMNEYALQVHPEVLEYDRHLRELSGKAESVIQYTEEPEIIRAQEEFLARVAPLHMIGERVKGKGERSGARGGRFSTSTGPKISTIDVTKPMIAQEKPLQEIARERNLSSETIISHVEQLIARGDELNITYLKKEISQQHFAKLEKALEEVSLSQGDERPPFLSPVKSKVGANISFKEIRLARLLLGYVKKGSQLKADKLEKQND